MTDPYNASQQSHIKMVCHSGLPYTVGSDRFPCVQASSPPTGPLLEHLAFTLMGINEPPVAYSKRCQPFFLIHLSKEIYNSIHDFADPFEGEIREMDSLKEVKILREFALPDGKPILRNRFAFSIYDEMPRSSFECGEWIEHLPDSPEYTTAKYEDLVVITETQGKTGITIRACRWDSSKLDL